MSVYLYGCGGIGIVAHEVALAVGADVAGFVDDSPTLDRYRGYPVRPGIERDPGLAFDPEDRVFLCFGDNELRARLSRRFAAHLDTLVHPSALVSPTAQLGAGTMLFHASCVQADARLGEGVILNTGASVDHECRIGDYVHLAPNVTLCGFVEIGEGANLGAGSIVLPGKRVGAWATLGAGTVVIDDIPDHATAVGCPARIVRIGDGDRLVAIR